MRPGISFWKGSIELLASRHVEDKQEEVLTSAISISLRPKAARERSCRKVNNGSYNPANALTSNFVGHNWRKRRWANWDGRG